MDTLKWLLMETLVFALGGAGLFFMYASLSNAPYSLAATTIQAWTGSSVASNLLFWLPGSLVFRDGVLITIMAQRLATSTAILFAIFVRFWTTLSLILQAALTWLLLDSPLSIRVRKAVNPAQTADLEQ
jgi:hypothetical protein